MLPSQGYCEDQSKNVHDLALKVLKAILKTKPQALLSKQLSQIQNQWESKTCSSQSFFLLSDFRVFVGFFVVVNIYFAGVVQDLHKLMKTVQ